MTGIKNLSLSIFYQLDLCGKLIQDAIYPLMNEKLVKDKLEDVSLSFNANRGNNIRLILGTHAGETRALIWFVDRFLKSYLSEYPSMDEDKNEDPINLFCNYPNNSIRYNHFLMPRVTDRDVHATLFFNKFSYLLSKTIIEWDFRLVSNVRLFIDKFSAECYRSIGEIVVRNEFDRNELYRSLFSERCVFNDAKEAETKFLSSRSQGAGMTNPIESGGRVVKSFLEGYDDLENIRIKGGSLKLASQLCGIVRFHLGITN